MLGFSLVGARVVIAMVVMATGQTVSSQSLNVVRTATVESSGGGRLVRIITEREPAYTVFRLTNPMRIVIDIARGDVTKLDGPIEINDGVVGEIATAQFADERHALGRLIISLDRPLDYEVKGQGNEIRLTVRDPAQPLARIAPTPAPAPSVPVVAAKTEATPPVAARALAAPAASSASNERSVHERPSIIAVDKLLTKVATVKKKGAAEVLITIKGGTPAHEILELEDPPRVVIDLLGVKAQSPRPNSWNLGSVGRMRLGVHADKVRFVFDGIDGIPEYSVVPTANGVKILTSVAPKQPEPQAAALVAAARPEPVKVAAPLSVVANVEPLKPSLVTSSAPVVPAQQVVAPPTPATPPLVVAKAEPVKLEPPTVQPAKIAEVKAEVAKVEAAKAAPQVVSKAESIGAVSPKVEPVKAALAKVEPARVEPARPTPPKPTPAPVVVAKTASLPAPAPVSPGAAKITSVEFVRVADKGRIVIQFGADVGSFEIDRSLARAPVLSIYGSELVKDLEKSTDVTRSNTAVMRVTSFNERKGTKGVRLIANLKTEVENQVFREGDRLVWEFSAAPAAPAITVAAAVPVSISVNPAPQVAGFSTEAAQVVRTTTTNALGAGKRINIDLRNADLLNVLRLISEVSGENIVAGDDIVGKITLRLRNVPWEQALDVALKTKGFGRVRSGSIIRVAPLEKLQKEKEAELARIKADEQILPTFVRLIPINYAKATAIMDQIKPLLTKDRGKGTVDERTNTIIAEDLTDVLNKVENLARRLDTQTPQVLIEARIVEANTNFVRDMGIQWGGSTLFSSATGNATGLAFPSLLGFAGGSDDDRTVSTGTGAPPRFAVNLPSPVGTGAGGSVGFIFGNASNTAQLSLRLSALENNGSIRIVSAPKVTTLDNSRAKIAQGVDIPISVVSAAGVSTRFIPANLELEVVPHVTQDGSVMMEIKASKNEPNFSRLGAQGDPTIEKKFAETQVLVKDGDTTVIGGIYTRANSVTYNEVPFLSKIPVLGWLFKRKRTADERAELLVFITPRIINRAQASVVAGGGL